MSFNKKIINKLFYLFITTHLILWTLAPALTNNNLPLDTIEALAWGSNLDWGFNKHPPASAFFLEIFFQIFGSNDFFYYFLSQLFIIIAFFVIWKLASQFFENKIYCFLSVLILEGIYFYNYTTPEFNVYIAEIPFWALTVFYTWKSYNEDDLKNFIILGLVSAMGILSHYLFIYLLISIDLFFIYIFFIKKEKKFNFKYIVSLEIFLIMILPHLIWLNNNDFITLTYGMHRTTLESSTLLNHIQYPFIFILKQIGILAPFWLLLFMSVKKFKKVNLNFKDKKIIFLFFINFIPLLLIFITSLILGAKIKTMWMTPFYLFFGLFFIYLLKKQIDLKKLNGFLNLFLFFFILSPVLYSAVSISNDSKRTDYPGKLIATKIEKQWKQDHDDPIDIVLGNEWEAGNLSYHLKSRPIWGGFISKDKLDSLSKFTCIENVCIGTR
jgi:4-amino-4-deoxy-L-arabinose transferase-like glycosyltransferase|tara:strand:- start:754 stop:2073 length:1320 start_codon:yes stop_codon:yes gene_type:complete